MREEAEGTVIDLIKETINKVKDALSEEKKERTETEETLIGILENTCIKLNSISQM